MKCPIDNTDLVMSDRQGIEIDYCPQCRGVWLDRGEIDKIVERSLGQGMHTPSQSPSHTQPYQQQHRERRDYDDDYHDNHNQHHKRKESWLGDLFD